MRWEEGTRCEGHGGLGLGLGLGFWGLGFGLGLGLGGALELKTVRDHPVVQLVHYRYKGHQYLSELPRFNKKNILLVELQNFRGRIPEVQQEEAVSNGIETQQQNAVFQKKNTKGGGGGGGGETTSTTK